MHLGIVGATGAVGVEIISVLSRRSFPVTEITHQNVPLEKL